MAVSLAEMTSTNNPYPLVWVKLERYCEIRGENKDAVLSRLRRGEWLEGKHTKVKDGRRYVNVREADRWVEGT